MSIKLLKKIILVFVLGATMVGCDSAKDASVKKEEKITLTDKEKQLNKDEIAKVLVYKALVIEADNAHYTPEEIENIKKTQESVKVNYFVDRELKSKTAVTDKEVQDYYEKNKAKYNDKTLEETLPLLYQNLANEKFTKAQVDYYNSIIEKYKLNDILKTEGIIKDEKAKDEKVKEENKSN
ncbi:hypothetical protein FV113G1_11480 [Fusobacterium varium]|nr:hypothetical protein FV113G1_11480 [Fusobacterium varium]